MYVGAQTVGPHKARLDSKKEREGESARVRERESASVDGFYEDATRRHLRHVACFRFRL